MGYLVGVPTLLWDVALACILWVLVGLFALALLTAAVYLTLWCCTRWVNWQQQRETNRLHMRCSPRYSAAVDAGI